MQREVRWDLGEMLGEADFALKGRPLSTNQALRDLVADMASLALRDISTGTNNFLDEFLDSNVGSEHHYLALFFRTRAAQWYQEITSFINKASHEFDWFSIDDITQITPTLLRIKLNVGYYHENPDACMDITEFPSTSMSR